MQGVSAMHARRREAHGQPVVDTAYLDVLARRLAAAALLPLAVARKRVMQMAISARPH